MSLQPINANDALALALETANANDVFLDGEIAALAAVTSVADTALAAQQVTDEARITAVENRDTALEGRATSLEGRATALEAAVAADVTFGLGNNPGTTTGLTYGYKAGTIRADNILTAVIAGTVALTDNATNRVEVNSSGAVSATTSGSFTSGSIPLAIVSTSGGVITGIIDDRGALLASLSSPPSSYSLIADPVAWMLLT